MKAYLALAGVVLLLVALFPRLVHNPRVQLAVSTHPDPTSTTSLASPTTGSTAPVPAGATVVTFPVTITQSRIDPRGLFEVSRPSPWHNESHPLFLALIPNFPSAYARDACLRSEHDHPVMICGPYIDGAKNRPIKEPPLVKIDQMRIISITPRDASTDVAPKEP